MKHAAKAMLVLGLGMISACSVGNAGMSGTTVEASGTGETRSFSASNFDQVALQGPDDVIVKIGDAFSVSASGPSEILGKLDIRLDGNTLKIGRKRDAMFGDSHDKGATITVIMPAIRGADLAGSGNLHVDKAEAADFKGSVSGSGNLKIAALKADKASISVAGSGNLGAAGTVTSIKYSIAGSGDIAAENLEAQSASVSIAGSGGLTAKVTQNADVSVVGSGDVDIIGGAKCTTNAMGSGEVRCGN